ncbi:hypothetical protein M436DRAFT_72425 [Aureobasidium namibiae CBS 147.97]|uniref:Uncharacterized protein n=1 Tax=Aureobasidium namibiae CBS 147.97 TaxID=1043004 RepID=A0A074WR12_9PEZI
MSSQGTKVTNDPQGTSHPKVESAGTITSDSLAAESLSSNGSFGGAGSHAAASSQPSASTTTNNSDTSGARVLQAAPDAEARQALEGWNEEAQLNSARGIVGNGAGSGPAATSSYLARNTTADSSSGTSGAAAQHPHGKNITEGNIDASAPNASFTTDIGGKNDPGRQAVNDLARNAQQSAGDAGIPKDKGVSNDGQFDVLKDASA